MISDEAVEAAARAMAPAVWGPQVWTFIAHGETPTDARNRVQQRALQDARRALEAAAPYLNLAPEFCGVCEGSGLADQEELDLETACPACAGKGIIS